MIILTSFGDLGEEEEHAVVGGDWVAVDLLCYCIVIFPVYALNC